MNALRQTALSTGKVIRSHRAIPKECTHILLTGVPRTATPEDIRREINNAGARGVSDVAIDYEYFKPAERAILTLVSPEHLHPTLSSLKRLTISGIPVSSNAYVTDMPKRSRMRGLEGRLEAAKRGALTGHGPSAGIANNELTVTVSGLPARTTVDDLALVLKDFNVARSLKGSLQIIKLPLPPQTFSVTSRFIVVMSSVAEAHRLVRTLHASYLAVYGEESLISAKVIH